jgi:hypothetical protein
MNVYSTTYSNGYTDTDTCPCTAYNWINFDNAQVFSISGRIVTPEYFYAEANYYMAKEYNESKYNNSNYDYDDARSFHE